MSAPAALKARRDKILAEHGNYETTENLMTSADLPETPPASPAAPQSAPAAETVPGVTGFNASLFEVPADPGQNVPTSAPSTPAPAATTPGDEVWKHRYQSLQGMFDAKNEEIRLLNLRLKALEDQRPAPQSAPAPVAPAAPSGVPITLAIPSDIPALTTEMQDKYAGSLPVIRRVAADLMAEAMRPVLERLAVIERDAATASATSRSAQSAVVGMVDTTFEGTLYAQIPDLDAISRTPAFAAFMAKPIPYSGGLTIRQRLKAAYDARDTKTIVAIVNEFRASAPAGQTPTPAHFQQPGGQGGGQPPASPDQNQAKPMLAWSKRTEASIKFRKRQISAAEMQQISDLYEKAAMEGRVDMNA